MRLEKYIRNIYDLYLIIKTVLFFSLSSFSYQV